MYDALETACDADLVNVRRKTGAPEVGFEVRPDPKAKQTFKVRTKFVRFLIQNLRDPPS